MPWHVAKSDDCPPSRPWAVVKDADGSVVACHATQKAALAHLAALNTNVEKEARAPIGVAMKLERRFFDLSRAEVRAADGDGGPKPRRFTGHAAVFNTLSAELWGFYERIDPHAFDRAIEGLDDVRLLFNHNPDHVLARTRNGQGTLSLSKDETGLVAEADLPDTQVARDIAEMMDRGDLDQMSFGFRTIKDAWGEEELETEAGPVKITVRTLLEVELFDVSIVTFPAYPSTDAQLDAAAYRYLGLPIAPGYALEGLLKVAATDAQVERAVRAILTETVDQRVGKVLSQTNKEKLKAALAAIADVLAAAGDDEEYDTEGENSLGGLELARLRLRLHEHTH